MRFLHLLLNYFLFSGTLMFAAGATGLGGDSGGGDAGASSGASGGDAGSDSTGDSGEDAAGSTEDDSLGASGESGDSTGDGQGDPDPNAPVDLGDGRTVPAKWKSLFDAAKEKGLEKEVRQLFFGSQRLTQKFPGGINEAVQLADKVQDFGGLDGIGELKQDNEEFHADADSFLNTPDKWISETFSSNPEACLTAFAHSLDYVGQNHPEHYNHLMAKVIVNDLADVRLDRMYNVLAAVKDNPEAKALADELAKYYNHRLELSKKVPTKQQDDSKLSEKEQSLATKEEKLNNHTVNSQTIPLLGRNMTTQVEKLAKEAGFDLKSLAVGPARAMRGEILKQVMAKAGSDKVFARNYKAVMKKGETQRAIQMMNDKHAAILPEIARTVAKDYGIVKKAGAVRTAPGQRVQAASGNSSGSILRVNAKPSPQDIDWNRTGNRIYDSEAVLKNGKVVTWA